MKLSLALEATSGVSVRNFGSVKSVLIEMGEGRHDVLEIRLRNSLDRSLDEALGSPARFTWARDSKRKEMVGYIDTTSPYRAVSERPDYKTSLYMMGASYVMRDSAHRVWKNVTPMTIASDVLSKYQLALEIDDYNTPLSFMSQSGDESDWKFLRRLCSEIGFSLVADGTTVRMIDPLREVQRSQRREMHQFVLPSAKSPRPNVLSFTLRSTDTPVGGQGVVDQVMHGRTPDGDAFSYSSVYALAQMAPKLAPTLVRPSQRSYKSLGDAMRDAERIARMSRWAYVAALEVPGDPHLRPGSCALLADLYGPYSGLWYVVEVRHVLSLDPDRYTCALTISREALETDRRALPSTSPVLQRQSPTPKLSPGGTWQSSRQWQKVL